MSTSTPKPASGNLRIQENGREIRSSNILAAIAVADAVRTSLGPRGMDKMIQDARGQVVISNDGATILKQMSVLHPTAKMLVELAKGQDVEAGDGTTSVVVIAGALLGAAEQLLMRGIHPQAVSEGFMMAALKAEDILKEMSIPIELNDKEELIRAATTSLNSKVVSQSSDLLAPMAVDAVLSITSQESFSPTPTQTQYNPNYNNNIDLNDIRITKVLGGTVDDSELVKGIVLTQKISKSAGGPSRISNAKIGLIQFCISPAKTDIENNVTVHDYSQMDRILREERSQLAKMVKTIAKTGCNVLLIQKSILRDAVTNLSLDFLSKQKIMVVKDIERDDIEFISKFIGCEPVSSLDYFTSERLGSADLVFEENFQGTSIVRFTGLPSVLNCVSILLRGSTAVMLEEAERSLHDALCVVRSLVKVKAILPGGGAPEMELSVKLGSWSKTLSGTNSYVVRAYADALEVIPYTLAENAGLPAVQVITLLRSSHSQGKSGAGVNVKNGGVEDDMSGKLFVTQPLLVTLMMIRMATETVRMILKIDDIVWTR